MGMSALSARVGPLWRAARLDGKQRRLLWVSVALSAGALICGAALLTTSGYLISRAAQRPEVLSLLVVIVGVRAFGLARAGLRYAERLSAHDLALRHLGTLRAHLFARLVPLVPASLGARRGDLLARFVDDAETLQHVHVRAAIPVMVALIVSAAAALAAWLILPAAALAVLATLMVGSLAVPALSAWAAGGAARRQAAARADLTAKLVETIDGAPELVMAGQAQRRINSLDHADQRLAQLGRRDAAAASLATALGSTLLGAGLVATLVIGIGAVGGGALDAVLLAALALLVLGAYEAVQPLPGAARHGQACLAAARRLEEITTREVQVRDPAVPTQPGRVGSLHFDDVSLAYDNGPEVLVHAALELAPGARVGLLGPSGTGKSSLAELAVRFRDPTAGIISLDGVDLKQLEQEHIRRAVVLCAQDAHLFNTSVRENLLIANREASDQDLRRVLGAVQLDQLVLGLPQGLAALVGQEGIGLSGGERQRLALARALLSPSRFLILDEPTAHLDRQLARKVMAGVLREAGSRGLLVISHAAEDHAGLTTYVMSDGHLRPCDRGQTTHENGWLMPMPSTGDSGEDQSVSESEGFSCSARSSSRTTTGTEARTPSP